MNTVDFISGKNISVNQKKINKNFKENENKDFKNILSSKKTDKPSNKVKLDKKPESKSKDKTEDKDGSEVENFIAGLFQEAENIKDLLINLKNLFEDQALTLQGKEGIEVFSNLEDIPDMDSLLENLTTSLGETSFLEVLINTFQVDGEELKEVFGQEDLDFLSLESELKSVLANFVETDSKVDFSGEELAKEENYFLNDRNFEEDLRLEDFTRELFIEEIEVESEKDVEVTFNTSINEILNRANENLKLESDSSVPQTQTLTYEELMEQNIENINNSISTLISKSGDMSKMNIKLYPEELGSLDIELIMEGSVLKARLLVDNEITKNLFNQHLDELSQALLKQEITVEEFFVDLKDSQQNFNPNDQSKSKQDQEFEPMKRINLKKDKKEKESERLNYELGLGRLV